MRGKGGVMKVEGGLHNPAPACASIDTQQGVTELKKNEGIDF